MNRKVFKSMLTLCIAFLAFCYIMKFFFPQEFVMAISNDRIIAIGDFIDSHSWATYLCAAFTSFVTYYLYCCACSSKKTLKWREIIAIVAVIAIVRITSLFDSSLSSGLQLCSFVFLPYITGGKLKNCAIVYAFHCVAQGLSLTIRNLPIYFEKVNSAIAIVATMECYIWLGLMFVIFNYKKEN